MMEFRQTLFPDPVAPAINRCGIFIRSAIIGLPAISFPREMVILDAASINSGHSRISRRYTMEMSLLGTSIPRADLPGIGASMRTSWAARLRAISSASRTILLTLMPGAG